MKAIKVSSCRACLVCPCFVWELDNFPPIRCSLSDWPSVKEGKVKEIISKIYSWNRWGHLPIGSHGQELFDLLRSIGVEIEEEK